jgi:hypothetical protein
MLRDLVGVERIGLGIHRHDELGGSIPIAVVLASTLSDMILWA